jgi:aspartyl-tRNA(Asn)/glutamyl-tRNA(Gln) amidotransferase subunit C
MASGIDRKLIDHVAQLASLSLTEAEADKLTGEIAGILKYVGELSALDTSNVPPTAQVGPRPASDGASAPGAGTPRSGGEADSQRGPRSAPEGVRPDEARPGLSHEEAMAQAPRASQGGFAVPPFVEPGTGS